MSIEHIFILEEKNKMRERIFVLIAMVGSLSAFPAERQLQLSNGSRLDVVDSFTSRELWNVATPSSVTNGNVIVDSRVFDAEARPSNGKWRGCAIVMVGTGDLGVRPVAFRIWTTDACGLSVTSMKASSHTGSGFSMKINDREMAKIYVDAKRDVSVNDKVIGRISE